MASLRSLVPSLTAALAWLLIAAPGASAGVLSPQTGAAEDIRTIAIVVFAVVVVLGIALHGALAAALLNRRRPEQHEAAATSRPVQVRAGLALGSLAVALFVLGVVFTESARKAEPSGPEGLSASSSLTAQLNPTSMPRPLDVELRGSNDVIELGDPLLIRAIGQQWVWRFEHPGGRAGARNFAYGELVIPTQTLIELDVGSIDVLHRWWVPELGGKVDAVPGKRNRAWINVAEEGVYEGRSAAYSGTGYPSMRIVVRAVSAEQYLAYLEQLERELAAGQEAALEGQEEVEPEPIQDPAEDQVEG